MRTSPARSTEVSVILPCRNEEASLGSCIRQIQQVLAQHAIAGEIIVSDSSTDRSPTIAQEHGVKLVRHGREGYGNAYRAGFAVAQGTYLFCADPDGTYDFHEIPRFIGCLRQGYDLIIGNRFGGTIARGAMPLMHRYIGNPLLSCMLRLFFRASIHDAQCGMRALRTQALRALNLRTTGMEFASEMIVKAIKHKLRIKEMPIDYHVRRGRSKLKTLNDGWRHLRFMLLLSPTFLFFIPGATLFLVGVAATTWLYLGNPELFGIHFVFHPMFISSLLTIVGYQTIIFALFAKTYAITHLGEESKAMNAFHQRLTLETGLLLGALMNIVGFALFALILYKWIVSGFGELLEVKNAIIALTLITIGIQTIFSSFMLSILGIRDK